MGLPHLEKSVCGCSVETGSKVIGFFLLTMRILAMLMFFFSYLHVKNTASQDVDPDKREMVIEALFIVTVVTLAFVAIIGIFDVLLLIGIYKRRPSFIYTWVVVQIIVLCFGALGFLRSIVVGIIPSTVIQTVVSFVVTIYCVLIVNSHHTNLKEGGPVYSNN